MSLVSIISGLLIAVLAYLGMGVLFAIILLIKGLSSIDSGASDSGTGFKLLMIPGMVVFWPFLWFKWKRGS